MQTLAQIRAILESRGLAPRHALGQNFLIDKNLLARLVDAAGLSAGGLALEVGPGTGTLTEALLGRGVDVVAGELDEGLAAALAERVPTLGLAGRFTLVVGDALAPGRRLSMALAAALGDRPFRLVANLPYAVATPIMLTLLTHHPRCDRLVVTIQREVADRLLAKPSTKDYGTLGIVAQAAAKVTLLAKLPPECFWPRPEVQSAMVMLERREAPICPDLPGLSRLCQRLFSQRRKQLGSTLGAGFAFPDGIAPTLRPEALCVEQWARLLAAAPTGGTVGPHEPESDGE